MKQKKLKSDRSLRLKLRSPGRPPVLHRVERWPFWKAIRCASSSLPSPALRRRCNGKPRIGASMHLKSSEWPLRMTHFRAAANPQQAEVEPKDRSVGVRWVSGRGP